MREEFRNMSDDVREKMFSFFDTALAPGGTVTKKEWKNLEIDHEKIRVQLSYDNPRWAQRVGSMLLFGMPQMQRNSLFTSQKRTYPVVFSSASREEKKVTYELPEGYEVVQLPEKVVLTRDFAAYERVYRIDGGKISGTEVFTYKESRTPVSRYKEIRDFFDDITRMTNDLIMIKKKG